MRLRLMRLGVIPDFRKVKGLAATFVKYNFAKKSPAIAGFLWKEPQ